MFPASIQNLISEFNKLPGIGSKTSERFAFFLLKQPDHEIQRFARALLELKRDIKVCKQCYQFTTQMVCNICSNPKRDASTLCVIAHSQDITPLEKTGQYRGLYHVLGGVLNQIENTSPSDLRIQQLIDRLKGNSVIKEILIATNPDLEGETTALYLLKILRALPLRITRLARGLPMGADIEYADEVTLASAIQGRREM